MKPVYNSKKFKKEMNNIMKYSIGFLDGVQKGKTPFLKSLGVDAVEIMKQFVDSNARVNPSMLHHIYEWNRTGSPAARLYDINFTVSNIGLSFKSSFRQSESIQDGSKTPFYDKARIIENGLSVVIKPRSSEVLAFEEDGEMVFTKKPIRVSNPGGVEAQGGFEQTMDLFFNKYFSQSFLRTSGVAQYLENPVVYKKNLRAGKARGRSKGLSTGYTWVANAGVGA
jgi:hypothetical protein